MIISWTFYDTTQVVDWYFKMGADGIFSVCQSSEMFFLSEQEKFDIAKAVKEASDGRIKVIASGHTAKDINEQVDQLGKMAETKVDAVVLVSNRLADENESSNIFDANAEKIFRQLPGVTFGLYECPFPYLRLLTDQFLKKCAQNGNLIFLKDVSCNREIQKRRVKLVEGCNLSLFNANTSTLLASLKDGYNGYNGVMANFHIDIYKWLYNNYKDQPELAKLISDFLTLAAVCEARSYPVNAKYHQNRVDVPMSLKTRCRDISCFNENSRHETNSLISLEKYIRDKLQIINL